MRRDIKFRLGYDKRDEGQGWHGMEMLFRLYRSEELAIQARLHTGWLPYPKYGTLAEMDLPGLEPHTNMSYPMAMSIYIHSARKLSDYWDKGTFSEGGCDVLGTSHCWGTGGGLVADDFQRALLRKGEDAAWAYLDQLIDAWT